MKQFFQLVCRLEVYPDKRAIYEDTKYLQMSVALFQYNLEL